MSFVAAAILFILSVFSMECDHKLYVLSCIIGVPPGHKLDHIMNTICQHGYNTLKKLQYYATNDAKLKSFGFNTMHIKRWNNYIATRSFYKIPKEKQSFKNTLSYIIRVPPGPKLDAIMRAFSQNGYNAAEDLWDVEKEELRSFGLKNLHILRWRIYFTHERIYLVEHRWQVELNGILADYPEELSMRLEQALENETGPITRKITNGLTYQLDPVARTETAVLSGKLFGKPRTIKRVQERIKNKISVKDAVSDIIDVLPGSVLTQILNAFFQNGYKAMEDLWYAEEQELRSFGLHESHVKDWEKYFNHTNIYLIQSHWQCELDGVCEFYKKEISRYLEETLENETGPITYAINNFIYLIDPVARTQTNVQTEKTIKIRRIYNKMAWNNDIQDFFTVEELALLAKKDEIQFI